MIKKYFTFKNFCASVPKLVLPDSTRFLRSEGGTVAERLGDGYERTSLCGSRSGAGCGKTWSGIGISSYATGGTYSKCAYIFIFICKRLTLLENRVATNFGEDRSSNAKCADI